MTEMLMSMPPDRRTGGRVGVVCAIRVVEEGMKGGEMVMARTSCEWMRRVEVTTQLGRAVAEGVTPVAIGSCELSELMRVNWSVV